MEWIPRNFLHCCKERYIIRFSSPYFSPKDVASNYVVWYTYPNKKQESVQVETLTIDQLVVSESPKSDNPCAVSVAVQSKLNRKVVAYFTVELLSLADYLFKKVFFPFKAITPEVVDPHIVNRILAMFMAYYCNIGEGISDERQQTDGILQTLLSQLKDHKGNLASITTGPYGTQENIIHFALRNKLDKTARYLIRNMRGYDHLFLEHDKNHKTPLDLAHVAGFGDLDSDIKQKMNAKKPLVRTQSNTAYEAQYENPSFHTNGNKHLRKGIVKERYKHPGLLEILEVGDTVDVISGPDGGVYEVMIRDNHCFIPEVIIWVDSTGDHIDASHTYEEIDNQSKASSENSYMTLKSPVEAPRIANHYVVEPPSAAVSINERSPLAPPRNKDTKKPAKIKSATLPTPKKSAPVHKPAPYRPPPPRFASTSAVPSSPSGTTATSPPASISAPPRKKKSVTEEHVYEVPTVNQSTSVSSDTVKEAEECYVEPVDVETKDYLCYLEICGLPSAADGDEPKAGENSTSSSSTASASKEADDVAVKSAVTDVATKTNDENSPAHDSLNQKAKETADSTDVKEKDQNLTTLQAKKMFEAQSPPSSNKVMSSTSKVDSPAESAKTKVTTEQKPKAMDNSNTHAAYDNGPKTNENSTNSSSTASASKEADDVAVKSAVTDVATKTNDENSPAHDSLNQKAKETADSTDVKEKDQNLTTLQAKKMFEAQSPPSSNKVMSRTSKVDSSAESAKTKAITEQKPKAMDNPNTPAAYDNGPKTNENSTNSSSTASASKEADDVAVKSAVTDVATKTNDENSPAHDLLDQKAKEPAKEKDQNLTILQAKKMFEAQSPPSSNKVMSRTSKVGGSESAKTKVATEQKPEAMDNSNTPSDLPKTPIQPEASESMAPAKQETSSNMVDNKSEDNTVSKNKVNDVQKSKNLIPAKPSKPNKPNKPAIVANKPHINLNAGGDQR